MHNDEVVWQCCGRSFCSFKAKFEETVLCRNIYNVNGICCKASCPLANSYYGTILEEHGTCYLYLKTIERAHTPRRLWEKIKLSENTKTALQQIETHMKNVYKDHQIHRCKKRLLKIREYLLRMRKMAVRPEVVKEYESQKVQRREKAREAKALVAARIETSVEKELVARLKAGHYGEIYNYPQQEFTEALEGESESEGEMIERGEDDLEAETDASEEDLEDMLEA